jgi:hypothetical protein
MELSQNLIKAKRPCADGYKWFLRNRDDGSDYQRLLDALVRADRVADACWLLQQFGPTDAVLMLNALDAKALVFAGTVIVKGSVDVESVIRVGHSIRVGAGIRAGTAIVAGTDIDCGECLQRWLHRSWRRYQGQLGSRGRNKDRLWRQSPRRLVCHCRRAHIDAWQSVRWRRHYRARRYPLWPWDQGRREH